MINDDTGYISVKSDALDAFLNHAAFVIGQYRTRKLSEHVEKVSRRKSYQTHWSPWRKTRTPEQIKEDFLSLAGSHSYSVLDNSYFSMREFVEYDCIKTAYHDQTTWIEKLEEVTSRSGASRDVQISAVALGNLIRIVVKVQLEGEIETTNRLLKFLLG